MWIQAIQLSNLKFIDAVFGFVGAVIVCMATALEQLERRSDQIKPESRKRDFKPVVIYLGGGTLCGLLIGGTEERPEVSSALAVLVGATWFPLAIQLRQSGLVILQALADHYSSRGR